MLKRIQKRLRGKSKGFTLIELIVVIAIIGILAVIAIPKFAGIQTATKLKADNATAAQIISVAHIIEADNPTLSAGGATTSFPATGGNWTISPTTYMDVPSSCQSTTAHFGLTWDGTALKYSVTGPSTTYVEP